MEIEGLYGIISVSGFMILYIYPIFDPFLTQLGPICAYQATKHTHKSTQKQILHVVSLILPEYQSFHEVWGPVSHYTMSRFTFDIFWAQLGPICNSQT